MTICFLVLLWVLRRPIPASYTRALQHFGLLFDATPRRSSRKRKATQVLTESKHIWAAKRPDKQPKQGYRGHNPTIENQSLRKESLNNTLSLEMGRKGCVTHFGLIAWEWGILLGQIVLSYLLVR